MTVISTYLVNIRVGSYIFSYSKVKSRKQERKKYGYGSQSIPLGMLRYVVEKKRRFVSMGNYA